MRKGDLVLHDQAQPFMLEFGRYSRSAMISIARPLVCDRLPHASDLTARRIPARSKLAPFAGSIVRHLMQLNDLTDSTARQISVSALDVFTTMLELELTNREESTSNRAGLEQAKRFIMANLGDASLTLEAISRAQQIAPRTLTRLFAREGTTPIRWLWQQRLAASYRALAEGRIDRVTDAALAFGFNDLSHFSRSFKAAFGRSPQTFKSKK